MGKRLRVLLVEDSEDDAFLLDRELRRGGYDPECERVYTASGMEDALQAGDWDIVVSDHSMPSFSSGSALAMLRDGGYPDLPFIIVSGKIGEDSAVEAMRAGAQDYFMKDNLARLNTAIDRELREAENRRERRRARRELARSEERYRTFVAQSTEGIWRAEIEEPLDVTLPEREQVSHLYEHIVFAEGNDAMAKMYGFERAGEIVGLRLGDFMPRDEPEGERFLLEIIRSGYRTNGLDGVESGYRVTDVESREIDRWGNVKYFLNNFVGIFEDGMLVRVWGTQKDITERRKAEEALRVAEEKYRGIFENAVEGIYQTSSEGRLLTANPAMARMLGYDSPEDLMENVHDVAGQLYVAPEQRELFGRKMRESDQVSGFEVELRRRDGRAVWVSAAGRAVRGPEGEMLGYEGTMEDITVRRGVEEALRQSEALYRSVVENATENIFIVDVESKRILEANDALERSLGYSSDELRRMTLYDLVADEPGGIDERVGWVVESGRLHLGERRYLRKDGTLAEVEVGASVLPYDGRDAMCVVAHDVTERNRAEAALGEIRTAERRRLSRDLHDGVLQDLSFTMQSMQLERKLHGARREEEGKQIDALRRAVAGIRDAIYDLRLDSVLQSSLDRSLESLVELNRQMVPERPLDLSVEEGFPEDLRGLAAVEVCRVVQEALANVRRHSGASRARVSLRSGRDSVVVEVSDDGEGFSGESVSGESVSGVGLSSMRERSEAVNGTLEVSSEREEGTNVVLTVPISSFWDEDQSRAASQVAPQTAPQAAPWR